MDLREHNHGIPNILQKLNDTKNKIPVKDEWMTFQYKTRKNNKNLFNNFLHYHFHSFLAVRLRIRTHKNTFQRKYYTRTHLSIISNNIIYFQSMGMHQSDVRKAYNFISLMIEIHLFEHLSITI